VKKLINNAIEAIILKGKYKGKDVLIPRIPLIPNRPVLDYRATGQMHDTLIKITMHDAPIKIMATLRFWRNIHCFSLPNK
jgi:hypothetical protein